MVLNELNVNEKYDVIIADPPWKQRRGGYKKARPHSSGKELPYSILSIEEIKEHLKLAYEMMPEDGVLFLWTIDKYLIEAQKLAEDIGFKLHARMIWDKVTGIPASFDIRFGHEYLLYMYKGKLLPVAKAERGKIHSVFREKCTKHSKKPEISFEIVERLYPSARKFEMYARAERKGWDCWGNEVQEEKELQNECVD